MLLKVARCVLDLRAGARCAESYFSVMGAVHSNARVRKPAVVVTSTMVLDTADKPGFGIEEK